MKSFSAVSAVTMVFLNTLKYANEMFLLRQNNLTISIVFVLTTVISYYRLCGARGPSSAPSLDPPLYLLNCVSLCIKVDGGYA